MLPGSVACRVVWIDRFGNVALGAGPADLVAARLADAAELRAELAARHPEMWSRVQSRRAFMSERLGITIADEVLPLSEAPAYFAPFWLSPDHALVSG